MFDQVQTLVDEYADLERQLADPSVHADQSKAKALGRRYAELGPIVTAYQRWVSLGDDITAARELAGEDSAFADEAQRLEADRADVADQLTELLIPRDPDDDKDVILEVKAGEGGDEHGFPHHGVVLPSQAHAGDGTAGAVRIRRRVAR